MAKTKITMENISEFLNSLPYTQFKALVENYAKCNQNNFDKEMKRLVKVEANTHWGCGGGNQYYIDKDTFNEGVNRGVFQYNEDKSFMESKGNLERKGVSEDTMDVMDARRTANIDKQLSSCPDQNATTSADKAKSLNEITPEKENKINSDVAAKGNYVTSPDPAYNYGQNTSVSKNDGTSPKTTSSDKVADGGGARAPNG